MTTRHAALWVLPLASLAACAVPGSGEGEPIDDYDDGSVAIAAGRYAVTTELGVTPGALAPTAAHDALTLIADLRAAPGAMLLDLAAGRGGPLADELLGAMPDALVDRLDGWLDAAIDAQGGAELDALLGFAGRTLTDVELDSTLELGAPDDDGVAQGRHVLARLRVPDVAGDVAVSLAQPGAGEVTDRPLTARVDSAGRLALGDHAFGLDYGAHAWRALEAFAVRQHGVDLRAALGVVVDCAAVAERVADRCVAGICVGHRAELAAVCEAGLDAAVEELRGRFEAERFEALRLASGVAAVDATGLHGGRWEAAIDLGQGPRSVPAAFVAVRD